MTAPNRANAGAPWSEKDEHTLRVAFAAGTPLHVMADTLQRSRAAIVTRLRLHNLIVWTPDGYVHNHHFCSFAETKDPK